MSLIPNKTCNRERGHNYDYIIAKLKYIKYLIPFMTRSDMFEHTQNTSPKCQTFFLITDIKGINHLRKDLVFQFIVGEELSVTLNVR